MRAGDVVRVPPTLVQYQQDKVKKTESGNRFSLADLEKLRKCIIHSDEDIVVFNKPAGLAVQGGTGISKSVDKMATELFPYDKISLVHRLDKETSGVLLVAKNQRAAQILAKEFQDKVAHKEYLALLMGNIHPNSGVIDNLMIKGRLLEEDETPPDGTKAYRAITEYKVISNIPGIASWVLFSPQTGRTHQLRIHSASSLNAPIIGDRIYGRAVKLDNALNSLLSTKNLFLFAYKLSFRHPGTNKLTTIRAELPDFMRPVVKFLEFKIPD